MRFMMKTPLMVFRKLAVLLVAVFLAFGPSAVMVAASTEVAFAMGNEAHQRTDDNGYDKKEDEEKTPTEKARDASNYFILDVEGIFASDGSSNNGLWDGMVKILQVVTSAIILPIAIVLTTWRCAYVATLVYIGHVDPLHMVFDSSGAVRPRYTGNQSGQAWQRRSGGVDWGSLDNFTQAPTANQYQYARSIDETFRRYKRNNSDWAAVWNSTAKRALLVEVKNMVIGLFVVFAIWSLLNVMIWLATILLNLAGETGGDVMADGSILQAFHMLM